MSFLKPSVIFHDTTHLCYFSPNISYFCQKCLIKQQFSDLSLHELKLMSSFKQKVNFSLNFGSLFSVMRNNSSVLFQLKLYMIWTKGAHQSEKFQAFDCLHKISPNFNIDRLLKVYKVFAKKYRGVMSHDPEGIKQNSTIN